VVGDSATLADYSLATSIAVVLTTLGEEERKPYPNVTAWYLSLVATDVVIGSADLPKEAHKAFRAKQAKQEKKVEQK
jgi:glutathione S-transferase